MKFTLVALVAAIGTTFAAPVAEANAEAEANPIDYGSYPPPAGGYKDYPAPEGGYGSYPPPAGGYKDYPAPAGGYGNYPPPAGGYKTYNA